MIQLVAYYVITDAFDIVHVVLVKNLAKFADPLHSDSYDHFVVGKILNRHLVDCLVIPTRVVMYNVGLVQNYSREVRNKTVLMSFAMLAIKSEVADVGQ